MPFADSFPLRARGPKSDLSVVYGRFDVSNSGATITAQEGKTCKGLAITGSAGSYVLAHTPCRFAEFFIKVRPADNTTVSETRHVVDADDQDPSDGTFAFVTQENDSSPAVAAPVDGSEIVVFGLMGF